MSTQPMHNPFYYKYFFIFLFFWYNSFSIIKLFFIFLFFDITPFPLKYCFYIFIFYYSFSIIKLFFIFLFFEKRKKKKEKYFKTNTGPCTSYAFPGHGNMHLLCITVQTDYHHRTGNARRREKQCCWGARGRDGAFQNLNTGVGVTI